MIDTVPRVLTGLQREGLRRLAHRASDALESRRLQRDAEQGESALARLLDAMPDGVVTCGADGRLREFNGMARAWHGVDPRSRAPEEWAEYFDLYRADGETLLPTAEVPLLRALRGERVRDAEIVIRAAGQPARAVRCNADAFHAADGTLLGAVCVMVDISGLRAAEDAVRVEAERFSGAFTAAAQGMALVSLEGRWLEVNDALCDMFGYARDELLALDFQRLTHPEDLQSDLSLVTDLLLGKRARYQLDKRYFHRTGQVIHAHLSVSLVRDAQGRPLHFVSQIQDYTQRHRAEQRLRESEQKYRGVLEHTHDAFIAADDAGRILEWNPAAEATFGWRRSEVLGKPMDEIVVPPRLREAHRAGMARYLRTGENRVLDQRLQMPAWHRAGHEFPIEMTISRLAIGGRDAFSAFLHDISARERAREALKASVSQLRTIADNVPALIAHVGADLRYRFVNRGYAAWFGLEPEAIVGRAIHEVMDPVHYESIGPRVQEVLAGRTVTFDADVRDADGRLRHMRATYVPEPRADGDPGLPASFHIMVHDQTAQVQLARMLSEQALRDELTGLPNRTAWNEELERAVARARRSQVPMAAMFLDLDGFKAVNDTHGHAAGDHVLTAFAGILRDTLRSSDFVARLAGDEFVVLLDRVTDVECDPPNVATKIIERAAAGTVFDGVSLAIRPSIGIGVQHGPTFDAAALMRCADEAMYAAKRARNGHPCLRVCDPGAADPA